MNEDIFKGNWNQFKGKVKEKWGKLTDDELTQINGRRDQLLGKLQTRYGWEAKRAEEELKSFEDTLRNEGRTKRDDLERESYPNKGKRVPFKTEEEKISDEEDKGEEDYPQRKVR